MDTNHENQDLCSLTQSYFDFINYELYLNIFKYLNISGINKVFLVCKLWSHFSNDDHLWKLLFQSSYPERFKFGKPNQTTWKWLSMANSIDLTHELSSSDMQTTEGDHESMEEEEEEEKKTIGYRWKNNELYAGEWKHDTDYRTSAPQLTKNGLGALYIFDPSNKGGKGEPERLKDVYMGEFAEDYFDGFGIFFWKNGNKYLGDWSRGKQSGKGKMFWNCGESYSGHWLNNLKEGKGKYFFKDGSFYEGDFKKNKIEGSGRYQWSTGTYVGSWKNNKRDGFGQISWEDTKNTYEGFFLDNQKHGYGKYTWKDGSFYEGDWEKDKRSGKGKTIWSNGMIYVGGYDNDFRNGKGVLIWSSLDNCFFLGSFKDGGRRGHGCMIKGASSLIKDKLEQITKQSDLSPDPQNLLSLKAHFDVFCKDLEAVATNQDLSHSITKSNQIWAEPSEVQYSTDLPPLEPDMN